MRHTAPTLRELHTAGFVDRAPAPRRTATLRAPRRFWDDPDLAPAPRKEAPLSCWT